MMKHKMSIDLDVFGAFVANIIMDDLKSYTDYYRIYESQMSERRAPMFYREPV